jgi:hypothetical protein
MKKSLLFGTFIFVALSGKLQAQQMLGIANSNFAGIHGLYTNPSNIVDSRLGFHLNLMSFDLNISNNYLRYNNSTSILNLVKNEGSIEEEHLEEVLNGKPKLITTSVDFRGPSFMLTLSPKHSLAVTTRVRGAVQGNNISEQIARYAKTGGSDEILNQVYDNNEFNVNGNVNAELGLSYGRVVFDNGRHVVKSALTVKRVTGIFSSYFLNEGSRYKVVERTAPDAENYKVIEIDQVNAQYGYLTEDLIKDVDASDVANWLTKDDAPGKGWGLDLGFTYEFRPNIDKYYYKLDSSQVTQYQEHRKNKYKYRLGVALMDLGRVNYSSDFARSLAISKQKVELAPRDLEDAETSEEYAAVLNNAFGIQPSDIQRSFRSGLPTALNVNLDTRLARRLYVNTTWIQSLRNKTAIGMRQNSLLAVTPRLEFKLLELAVPVSLSNNYSVFAVGAMAKLGPVFIGSDNIAGALNIGKPYGANVYFGISLLSLKREKKQVLKKPKVKKDKTPAAAPTLAPVNN